MREIATQGCHGRSAGGQRRHWPLLAVLGRAATPIGSGTWESTRQGFDYSLTSDADFPHARMSAPHSGGLWPVVEFR